MIQRWRMPRFRLVIAIATVALVLLGAMSPASATAIRSQSAPGETPPGDIDELIGMAIGGDPFDPDEEWTDPALLVGLDPEDLEPAPEFDRLDWHDSTVFATGVDLVVTEQERLEELTERYVRVRQVQETLDREIDEKANDIDQRRPQVGVLLGQIDHELENEDRLVHEIAILRKAIAEYAVRAFISEDDINRVVDELSTDIPAARIVTNEVRDDQVAQIDDREREFAERQRRRAGLEAELRGLRSELRVLRSARLELLEQRRTLDHLADRVQDTYRVELHTRLPLFAEGTDLPLVALNAYVIAARTLNDEVPECGITWSMLAGIGRIESFHGHFEPSTLDINGQTTADIFGPALDGRILEGAEFLTDGAIAPEATGRTEEQTIAPSTADTGAAPPEALASTEGVGAAATAETTAATNPTGPAAAPVPVIKRLALIEDTDDGRLDDDTIYDRAVGPMQFIPQTWRRYNADGNADGESDPQNIYDAALASARYLCAATPTMRTLEGQQLAYFAYNHDLEYTENVLAASERYAQALTIEESAEGNPAQASAAEPTRSDLGIANPANDSAAQRAVDAQRSLPTLDALDW